MTHDPSKKKKKKGKKGNSNSNSDDFSSRQFLGKMENNHCRVGIVGLPNIGKSSLFNTLSAKQVPAENYPFCTIKPAQTQVAVPDKRFVHLCEAFNPKSRVQAVLEIWDIAGLVRGAHEGQGLGNEFLANIQAVDAIFHVVRAFRDSKVEHVEGTLDPVRDMTIISEELRFKDLQQMSKRLHLLTKSSERTNDKRQIEELALVKQIVALLESGKDMQSQHWPNKYLDDIRTYNLFTAKPVVFLVNVSESNWTKGHNKYIKSIQEWVSENYEFSTVIPFCAKFEKKLSDMDTEAAENHLIETKTKSMINKIIHQGYKALHLVHFFTCGEDEVRCWTIRKGSKAPRAAGVIHSDMENGFICAETYAYKSFKKYKSESACKSAGKYLQNGRNYVVKDGDILFFKFTKPSKPKKSKGK